MAQVYVDGTPYYSAAQVDALISKAVKVAVNKEWVRVTRYYENFFNHGEAVYYGKR